MLPAVSRHRTYENLSGNLFKPAGWDLMHIPCALKRRDEYTALMHLISSKIGFVMLCNIPQQSIQKRSKIVGKQE